MLYNYLKVSFRNLKKSRLYSFINIAGLAIGMAVSVLIGLWVWNELSFDKAHSNYKKLAQVWQIVKFTDEKSSYNSMPVPLAEELRTKYPEFEKVSVATYKRDGILTHGEKKLSRTGMFVEKDFPSMMTPEMIEGSYEGLADLNSIFISQSLSKSLFGDDKPVNKVIRINNKTDVKVAGVYKDFPENSSFSQVYFLGTWQLFRKMDSYADKASSEWDENSFQLFAQLKDNANIKETSAKIKDIRMKMADPPKYKPEFFLHPMSNWHLRSEFKNGVNTGGLIRQVKLFAIIGIFILLLACVNFMNLSTARSEKRAKEVGIRKTLGSARKNIISQFFSESILVTLVSLIACLGIVQLLLPFFNTIAAKHMSIPWTNIYFWLIAIIFCLLTGIIAGSYPAFYLSSFQPIKVLKGRFKAGQLAALPRKVLVVFQFTVSVVLIIGTIIVSRQISFGKDRSVGYERNGLIEVSMNTPDIREHIQAIETDLLNTGVVTNVSEGTSLVSDYGGTTNISWKGKSPDMRPLVMSNLVTHDFGKTVGWKVIKGRDFSKQFSTDTSAIILNLSALQLMGFDDPLNEVIRVGSKHYNVIGVIDNIIRGSPFESVKPSFYTLNYNAANILNMRLASQGSTRTALAKIENVFKKYNPAAPFDYKFVDEQYAAKFGTEERIAKLAGFFAMLAIFISCLGLFGLASFVAEQRTKEIGIRKVLGASIASVLQLLSKEFLVLVVISLLIASPAAWYFMQEWLTNYEYRTEISWWIFGVAGSAALLVTILTVGFQAIKAALANPIKSLRTE